MAEKHTLKQSPHLSRQLWEAENLLIHRRRHGAGEQHADQAENDHVVGLALSGGGIRSATISVGVLQALAKHGCLRRIDYLSTVSGGGYAGAFLGGLYERWNRPQGNEARASAFERVENALQDPKGHPIDWLRENGRYLAPNGAGSLALAAAIMIRNLFAIHLVIGTFFLMLSLMVNGLRRSLTSFAEQSNATAPKFIRRLLEESGALLTSHDVWFSPIIYAAALVLILTAIPAGIAYWLVPSDERHNGDRERDWVRTLAGPCVLVASASGFLHALRSFDAHATSEAAPSVLPVLLSGGLCVSMLIALLMAFPWRAETGTMKRTRLTTRLRDNLITSAAVLGLALIDTLGQTLYVRVLDGNLKVMAAGISGAFALAATVATCAQRLAGLVSSKTHSSLKLSASFIATITGFSFLLMILIGSSAISHSLSWDDSWIKQIERRSTPSDPIYELSASEGTKWLVSRASQPAIVCRTGHGSQKCTPLDLDPAKYWTALAATLLLTFFFGHTRSFVNRSSLATFYGTRLARAYLGASNSERLESKNKMLDVLLPHDELALADYRPHLHGGPLPLINVTLNETTGGRSQVDQRDRKGMNMAIGPAGISVGVKHHALWTSSHNGAPRPGKLTPSVDPVIIKNEANKDTVFRVFPDPKQCIAPAWPTLGRWIAISGAAVSTGLGARTSAGLALLLGLLNFRLGHWWNSGIDPTSRSTQGSQRTPLLSRALRRALPVHAMLLHELFARFPGTSSRDWYLSDGGHFENSGAYELIRRRLPYIIVCDNGADPKRCFNDLGNLVRKARSDFGAHIELVGPDKLRELNIDSVVGSLAQLGFCGRLSDAHALGAAHAANLPVPSNTNAASDDVNRYATLARIRYEDAPEQISALLILRPAVLGREPLDVLNYQIAHEEFPQQSTGDQFFDEEQWEAYRRLGENMADEVFSVLKPVGDDVSGGWQVFDLDRLRSDVQQSQRPAAAMSLKRVRFRRRSAARQ